MKKTKLLLAVAMAFGVLLFGFNRAKAQTTVPVILHSSSPTNSSWTSQTTWTVALHNNTTNEDYTMETSPGNLHDDGDFHLGYITPGTYTVTVNYYNPIWIDTFDWYINDQYQYNKQMYVYSAYTLTDNVVVSDDTFYTANYGLSIYLYAL